MKEETPFEEEYVYKWIQVAKKKVPLHNTDKESPVPRSFIFKDFLIYFLCYLIPPFTLLLNKYTDYPLKFYTHPFLIFVYNKIKDKLKKGESKELDLEIQNHYCMLIWIAINSFLLVLLLFVTLSTNLLKANFILVEKFGTAGIYILRCFANSYISATSEVVVDLKYLKNYPIWMPEEMQKEEEQKLKGDTEDEIQPRLNAYDFYSYVTSLSRYQAKFDWKEGMKLNVLSAVIALIPPILTVSLRESSGSFFESFLVFGNIAISFPISVVLLRGFMQSFSLYQSMKSTMRRLMNSTFSERYNADKKISEHIKLSSAKKANLPGSSSVTPSTPSTEDKSSQPLLSNEKVILNLTHPDNLRAYFHTHGALIKRENSLESKLISLTASVIAIISILMVLIIFLNLYFENHASAEDLKKNALNSTGEFAKRMVGNIISLKNVDIFIMGYLVAVLVLAMIFIAFLGSGYNFAAKNAQAQYLYEVYLSATLELQCDGWNEKRMSKQRKGQLKTVIKLVGAMTKHFENHVNDLGILGFSYSSLYWYIFAFFSANAIGMIRRQMSL